MFSTPILLLIFNRPQTSFQVFERIRQQKPTQLFIASDGARQDKDGEDKVVADLRKAILHAIDWDCEVKTLFQDVNLGCGKGPAEAITWFFNHVNKGIILEDDILPDPSFFSFMQEMLDYYEECGKVMHVTGQNFQFGKKRGNGSYYFSRYPLIWGWGTWRRAWQSFDFEMKHITEIDVEDMPDSYKDIFKYMKGGSRDIWDYQWSFSVWKNGGVCIVPQVNLIQNLGFGTAATHTFHTPEWYSKLRNGSIISIVHPSSRVIDRTADKLYIKRIVSGETSYFKLDRVKQYLYRVKRRFYGSR